MTTTQNTSSFTGQYAVIKDGVEIGAFFTQNEAYDQIDAYEARGRTGVYTVQRIA